MTSNTAVLTVTAATLTSISVAPTSASIAKGLTQQFTATGHFSDGTTQDLTASATWSSSLTTVATIGVNTGLATGVAAGSTNITATQNSVTSNTAVLTVTNPVFAEPSLQGQITSQAQNGNQFTINLKITDTSQGSASNILINTILLRTLTGTGMVTYVGPNVPISVGNLAPGASTTVVLTFTVPSTVLRFAIMENGTVQDAHDTTLNYSMTQSVIP